MKEQIDKLIKSGNGKIKKISMSDKSYMIFLKEVFCDFSILNEHIYKESMSCIYRDIKIESSDMFVLNKK